jgi:hypothetical protein
MPREDAIVSTTVRFDPPLEGRDVGEAIASEGGLTVDLDGDRRVRLDPGGDQRSVGQVIGARSPAAAFLVGASMTAAAYLLPFLGWSAGWPTAYWQALLMSFTLAGASAILTHAHARRRHKS